MQIHFEKVALNVTGEQYADLCKICDEYEKQTGEAISPSSMII